MANSRKTNALPWLLRQQLLQQLDSSTGDFSVQENCDVFVVFVLGCGFSCNHISILLCCNSSIVAFIVMHVAWLRWRHFLSIWNRTIFNKMAAASETHVAVSLLSRSLPFWWITQNSFWTVFLFLSTTGSEGWKGLYGKIRCCRGCRQQWTPNWIHRRPSWATRNSWNSREKGKLNKL